MRIFQAVMNYSLRSGVESKRLPIAEKESIDGLIGGDWKFNRRYCLEKLGQVYAVYLANGGSAEVDLSIACPKNVTIRWYNRRTRCEHIEDKSFFARA
jgi:hypothetical protein